VTQFVVTRKAEDDLRSIYAYTRLNWGEEQADNYYQEFISTCEYICKYPMLGRTYDIVTERLRGFQFGKHIIFYQVQNGESILVIRVLHISMDVNTSLEE
jgi:toxin ParE1/3/4